MPELFILIIEQCLALGSSMSPPKEKFAVCEVLFPGSIDVLVGEGWAIGEKCKGALIRDALLSLGVEKVWVRAQFAIMAADVLAIFRFRQRIHTLLCHPVV